MMTPRRLKSLALSALLMLGASASAQVGPQSQNPWEEGRTFYGEGNYSEARRYIIEAIQREPNVPIYYLGLARSEYWLGHFDSAVYYYNVYLVDFANTPMPDRREADLPANVRGERDAANAARTNPETVAAAPPAVVAARAAFDARVAQGPILTSTGGGAVAMYEGMLRAGYADPDLVDVRLALANALMSEANGVVDDHAAALPVLTLAQWQTQLARLQWWLGLTPDTANPNGSIPPSAMDPTVASSLNQRARVRAHIALADAQVQYLNQNYAQAAEGFRSAFDLKADLLPAYMGRLNALARLGNAAHTAEPEITRFEGQLQQHAPDAIGTADVYRAAFAAQAGDSQAAAASLGNLLGISGGAARATTNGRALPASTYTIPTAPRAPTTTAAPGTPAGLPAAPQTAPDGTQGPAGL